MEGFLILGGYLAIGVGLFFAWPTLIRLRFGRKVKATYDSPVRVVLFWPLNLATLLLPFLPDDKSKRRKRR